jgi:folate-dependent phosphoribosylglycinamide formyltransferase PurN
MKTVAMTGPRKKALVLTSDSLRHRYFLGQIASSFDVVGAMSEPKRNYFNDVRERSPEVEAHFVNLAKAESLMFSPNDSQASKAEVDSIVVEDINTADAVAAAKSLKPDVICLFGTSILKTPWLEAFPDRIVNLHLGLSPYYRGAATLFWPFFYRELSYLGTTIHLAVAKVDAGAILKRVKATFEVGDNYYVITNRLIRDSIDQFPSVVNDYLDGKITPFAQETVKARVMKKVDFTEESLRAVLQYVGKGLTKEMIQSITTSGACLS